MSKVFWTALYRLMKRQFNTKYQAALRDLQKPKPPRKYGDRRDTEKIIEMLRTQPDLSYEEIGKPFGRTPYAVGAIAKRNNLMHGRTGPRRFVNRLKVSRPTPHMSVVPRRVSRLEAEDTVIAYVQNHPEMTYREVAKAFDLPSSYVGNLMYRRAVRRSAVTEERKAQQKELADYVATHPKESFPDIGRRFNVPTMYVGRIARKYGVIRGKGQGPRHNQGRAGYGVPRTEEEKEYLSMVMTNIWSNVSNKHRNRIGRIMRGSWTPERKHQMSLALKNMWREVRSTQDA